MNFKLVKTMSQSTWERKRRKVKHKERQSEHTTQFDDGADGAGGTGAGAGRDEGAVGPLPDHELCRAGEAGRRRR